MTTAMNIINNMEVWQFFADNATIGTTLEGINAGNATQVHPVILGEDIDVVSADADDDLLTGQGGNVVECVADVRRRGRLQLVR